MRVTVQGLWHLGSVTSACLAAAGHEVVAWDDDAEVIAALTRAHPPVSEPRLPELIKTAQAAGRLSYSTDAREALHGAEVLWVTYDTPVDDDDVADISFVSDRVKLALPLAPSGCLVVISSQMPVGTVAGLERFAIEIGRPDLRFACSPENLRLGRAIDVFMRPDRVVVGVRRDADAATFRDLMAPITSEILIMGVESAEMTKHAVNSFLAMSVAFANEIAAVCEATGADAREVAAGLRSEQRIGKKAYVGPGAAFAGGTLARDIAFLSGRAQQEGIDLSLIPSVAASNTKHRSWPLHRLHVLLGDLRGLTIAILGLTYKPGTDTLRRSSSLELAKALVGEGATVKAFDPAIRQLPPDEADNLTLTTSAMEAVSAADAVVVGTDWPEFRELDWPAIIPRMARPIVLDPNGMLSANIANEDAVTYASVGRISRTRGTA